MTSNQPKTYDQALTESFAEHVTNTGGRSEYMKPDFDAGFKKGAEWLQFQPLSDRLTEEEKEKINNLCDEIWSMNGNVAQYGEAVTNWLIRIETKFQRIFGTEPLKIKQS